MLSLANTFLQSKIFSQKIRTIPNNNAVHDLGKNLEVKQVILFSCKYILYLRYIVEHQGTYVMIQTWKVKLMLRPSHPLYTCMLALYLCV